MDYRAAHYRFLAFCAFGVLAAGCAPLTGSSASGTGSGTCANSLFSNNADAGTSYQQTVDGSQGVSQSFILPAGQSVSGVSLKLEGYPHVTPSTLSGTLNVYIVPDAVSGSSTPTTPGCGAGGAGSTYCPDAAAASGALSLSQVSVLQPEFYNISLSSKVGPFSSTLAYWIVAQQGNSSSSYVQWDGAASIGSANYLTQVTYCSMIDCTWNSESSQNMTFQVCK